MKKFLINVFVLIILAPFAYCNSNPIIDDQNRINPTVIKMFRQYKSLLMTSKVIPEDHLDDLLTNAEPTLEELNKLAQNKFLRPKGFERLSEEAKQFYIAINKDLSTDDKTNVIGFFKKLGDIDAVEPKLQVYDYILILGSTVSNMRDRVMYLASLFDNGHLKYDAKTKIVFLTGDRNLFASETEKVLRSPEPYETDPNWIETALPKNETDLGPWIYGQLKLPEQMRKLPTPEYIASGKREGEHRAQTSDTIKAWVEQSLQDTDPDEVKNCLIVSSNPLINYQVLTTKNTLLELGVKNRLNLEGVGPAADPNKYPIDWALGILLDNLTRTIYTQIQLLKNSKKVDVQEFKKAA